MPAKDDDPRRFTEDEVAAIIGEEVEGLIANLGGFDPGDPERVYTDTLRIMTKLATDVAERARDAAEELSDEDT